METTTIVIGLSETLGILVAIGIALLSGFGFVWKASRDAHKDIGEKLDSVIDEQCNIKVTMAAMSTNIRWLVKLQGGEPHGDQGS